MGRVSEEEIQRLKSEVSLERLATAAGVELKQHGKDLLGRCPFHDDREPSLVITPEKNLWHCLGECQTGGTAIDWVMKAEGVSFRYAVELLRERYIPSLVAEAPKRGRQTGPVVQKSTTQKLDSLAEASVDDQALLRRVVGYYEETLKQSPEAQAYLAERGLKHPEIVERFHLGFANRTLGYRLPNTQRTEGKELRSRLQKLGVLRESGHEHLNGSLVIPVFDEQGRVVEMYGRKLLDNLRMGTPKHLYLPGPHRGVWNVEALQASKEVILCESLIDALTFWCAGYRNVTAVYGAEGYIDDHREAFKRYGVEKVLIAYDADGAGDKAAAKLAAELGEMGIEAWRVNFPRGMDANEYARKVQPAEKALGTVLRGATWLGSGEKPGRVETEQVTTVLDSPPPTELEQATEEQHDAARNEGEREANIPEQLPSLAASEASSAQRSADGDEASFTFGDRYWRVRGLSKNKSPGILRVNILARRESAGFHVDTLELYSARHRSAYVKLAAEELAVEERIIKRDLGEVLLKLEELQERRGTEEAEPAQKRRELTAEESEAALSLLKDPRLLERILEDFDRCGVVGEGTNKLVGYLAATSRKLTRPLAIVVQSSSAAGKSSLMDAVLSLMPEEERVSYSAMTGQSLFYMGEANLAHRILAIAEEEGAERASYALKLLQSEGELTIASTGKDPATGRLVTQEYRVEGPVMIFLTTTAIEVDEELLNRCIVLTVDEGREQTRAIHERQRAARTIEGLLAGQERGELLELHQNAQRLLRPLLVANPFAQELRFLDHQTRTRRDHVKYLTLIESIALLHQYQRPLKSIEHRGSIVRYIEVTREDIELATELAREVLGSTLDQLPPKTRELLRRLDELVRERARAEGVDACDVRFTQREVRERTQLGNTQLKLHMGRLVEMEYLLVHRDRHTQRHVYSLGVGVEGIAEAICGYDAEPVGGGRGVVGVDTRPVLLKSDAELSGQVGSVRETHIRPKKNGSVVPKAALSLAAPSEPQRVAEA